MTSLPKRYSISLDCLNFEYVYTHVQVNFTQPGNHPAMRALSYYLIFFPTLDVMSAYPLTVVCITNNIYMAMTGRDTSKKSSWKYDWILRLAMRFVVAVVPISLAFGAANLVFILQYAGLLGFAICFLFPVVLQLRSIYVCNKLFGQYTFSKEGKNVSSGTINTETDTLLGRKGGGKATHLHYMTPYSNVVLSHPIFVVLVACFGFSFFVLSFVSLFISPDHVSCVYHVGHNATSYW